MADPPEPVTIPTAAELAAIGRDRWHAMTPHLRRGALALLRHPDGREALQALWSLNRQEVEQAAVLLARLTRRQGG